MFSLRPVIAVLLVASVAGLRLGSGGSDEPIDDSKSLDQKPHHHHHQNVDQKVVMDAFHSALHDIDVLLKDSWRDGSKHADFVKPHIPEKRWNWHAHMGSIKDWKARFLGAKILECKPTSMLEIGSFVGVSSTFYLNMMTPWGGKLTSVDPNIRHRVFEKPREFWHAMTEKFGDRARAVDGWWMTRPPFEKKTGLDSFQNLLNFEPKYTLEQVKDMINAIPEITPANFTREFDMAFIDGGHDEDSVLRDFENLHGIMKSGSCILFDDVASAPGVAAGVKKIKEKVEKQGTGTLTIDAGVAMFKDNGYFSQN